jgi:hypothetical protein
MGRIIAGAIVGYLVMAVAVFMGGALAWTLLGTDGALEPGGYGVTTGWTLLNIVISFGAALLGGVVCAAVARDRRGPRALALLVIVLGIVYAYPVVIGSRVGGPREGAVPMMEAMSKAVPPLWVALLYPVLGAAGVLIGARMRRPTAEVTH